MFGKPSVNATQLIPADNMSSIRRINTGLVDGLCVICSKPTKLQWRDLELGELGDCCIAEIIHADQGLKAAKIDRPSNVVPKVK